MNAIDRLRRICLALPDTSEKISHGEPTFWVAGRMFATLDDHHHGADHLAAWLAMPLGAQEALVYADPARYFVPPYVGTRGWVGMRIDGKPDWKAVERVVGDAYEHIRAGRKKSSAPRAASPARSAGRRRAKKPRIG